MAMSDHSNSANGNNWTIITSEAPVAENIGPVPEGSHGHGEYSSSVDPLPAEPIEPAQAPTQHTEPAPLSEAQPESEMLLSQAGEPAPGQSGTDQPVEQELVTNGQLLDDYTQNEDSTPSVVPLNSVAEGHESTSLDEHIASHDEHSVNDGFSESHMHPSTETDLFSDSYTHISPTPDAIHTLEEEEGLEEGRTGTEDIKLSGRLQESVPATQEGSEGGGLRKRNVSLLGSLDQHRKDGEVDEEEEEEGEEYRPPPAREEETGFTLNKCILGAVLLLGLGTIFFSESDDVKKDQDLAQEWLKGEGRQNAYADMKPPGLMDKENEKITVLQAQLKAQQEQLASAQQRLKEGVQEKTRREQLEQENQRMKGELESRKLDLEKENVKMRREQEKSKKELEGMSAIQRELSALKAKMGAVPSAGESTEQQGSHGPQHKGQRKDAKDTKKQLEKKKVEKEHKKEWKAEKELKKDKDTRKEGERKDGKEKKQVAERRGTQEGKDLKRKGERREEKEWKKKEKRAWEVDEEEEEEEGKTRKKEWKNKGERKEWKEDKKWKKDKSMDGHRDGERKEWREKEEKRKGKKEGKEWRHVEEDRAHKEDKKRKGDDMSDGKEWKKKKEWKDREEWSEESGWSKKKEDGKKKYKEWNESGQKKWKEGRNHNDERKEWRGRKEERKHSSGKPNKWSEDEEHGERKDHWKDPKWKKHRDEHHRDHGKAHWHKKEKHLTSDRSGQSLGDKTSSHPRDQRQDDSSYGELQGDYWSRQRQKLQNSRGPPVECSDAAACARAQGLVPVSLADFEALLLAYVDRLEGTTTLEGQTARKQELSKLVREFFASDGVFAHDRMPFSEFVEDVSDILEDMAEEEENQEMEEEMEGFEKEALEKFAIPEDEEKNGVHQGEVKKTSGRAQG